MNRNAPTDPFLRRLTWLTAAVILVMAAHYLFSRAERAADRIAAAPRAVTARGDLAAEEKATISLFEQSRGSVAFITTTERVVDFFSRDIFTIPRGTGSGFLWDDRGHVVTNFHVIAGAAGARVRLADGKEYKAGLVGASPMHDLAVLKISPGAGQPPLAVGASGNLKVGQKVFAIGNPFGLDWTLTTGIVSALDRSLKEESGAQIEHLIQTDAAINPGNSGGPLLDSAGRLIGVNTALYSPSGAFAGVGFAIPVDTVNRVVPQLIARGKYVRPALGISADDDLNDRLTRALGVKGVVVLRVTSGSGAAKAGVRAARIGADGSFAPGDIITAVEGKPISDVPGLLARLDDFSVGQTVTLTLLRDRREIGQKVTLQAE